MPEPRRAARFLSRATLGVSLCNRSDGGMAQCARSVRNRQRNGRDRAGRRLAELCGFMSCSVPAVPSRVTV